VTAPLCRQGILFPKGGAATEGRHYRSTKLLMTPAASLTLSEKAVLQDLGQNAGQRVALQISETWKQNDQGMQERVGQNRGELVRAQLDLQELETELEHLRGLLAERKTERRVVEMRIQEIAATGDIDKLVALQSRAVMVERNVAELSAAETECAQRVESARRYLYTLYVRLERLRQEFSRLMKSVAAVEHGETIPTNVLTNLGRVKIQLKAITGENSTGRL
jgi:chromosome segregation ATPase